MAGLSKSEVKTIINRRMPSIGSFDPEVKRAIEGIIDGVARAFEENNQRLDYELKHSGNFRVK